MKFRQESYPGAPRSLAGLPSGKGQRVRRSLVASLFSDPICLHDAQLTLNVVQIVPRMSGLRFCALTKCRRKFLERRVFCITDWRTTDTKETTFLGSFGRLLCQRR